MNKRIGLASLIIVCSLASGTAIANEKKDTFFVGASIAVNSDYKVDNPAKFNVGYQFHPNFAVELNQIDLGKSDNEDFENIDVDGYAAMLVAKYPLGNFNFYGKLGAFSWSEEGSYYDPFEKRITGLVDNSGTDILLGAGVSYHFNDYLAIKTEVIKSEFSHFGLGFDIYF